MELLHLMATKWMHTAGMPGAARSCGCFVADSERADSGCRPFISRLTSSVVDQSAKTDRVAHFPAALTSAISDASRLA